MFATSTLNLDVRPAQSDDLHALHDLVEQSVRGLLRELYTPRQIESSLKYLFGVDPALIEDGTYYLAEVEGNLAGAGGWSRRSAIYGFGCLWVCWLYRWARLTRGRPSYIGGPAA